MSNNKFRWGIGTSDVLSFAAFIVSLFALSISFKQLLIQQGQFDSQKKENQPIFEVTMNLDKVGNDSIEDTYILSIKNIGREAQSIEFIRCETFIKFEERYYQDYQTLYIPIIDFFASHGDQPKLIGEVITDITVGNNLEFSRFCKECKNNSLSLNRFSCQLVNFTIISYTDVYDESHTVFYENSQKCSKEYYDDIVKKSRDDFKEKYYRIEDLQFEDLKGYCKIDKTRKMAR